MRCQHRETKYKLVAWATGSRYGHRQGFKRVLCCAKCGCLVQPINPSETDITEKVNYELRNPIGFC